jgi:hypothetical protein
MTADDQERADRSIEDHYGLTSWNDALERRLCVSTPGAENSGRAIEITFEDLHLKGQAMGPLPSGYAGFTWSEKAWFMTKDFSSSASRFGLFNAHSGDITIGSKHLFDFKGLSLCTLWSDTAQVLAEGWEKQVRKYATTLTVKQSSMTPFNLDYHAIDRVELKPGGAHIVVNVIKVFIR